MDKDISAEPDTDKKTKPAAPKKSVTTKKTATRPAAKSKKPSRATRASTRAKAASKTVSTGENKPARKKRAPSRAGSPPKAARPKTPRKKAAPPSKPQIELEPKEAADLHPPDRVVGDTPKTRLTETPAEPLTLEKADAQPVQTAPAEISPATDTFQGTDPFKNFVRVVFIGLTLLIAIMILISYQNMNKYYITPRHGAVEIWKGKFSPKSKERILIMPGIQAPEQIKEVYTKEEVFPMAFHFYISKADALMEVPGLPDFVGIKSYLNRALSYATTHALRDTARARINSIDLMILLYKADAAASKGTVTGLETAIKYLDQASSLGPDEIEAKLIKQKLAAIQQLKELLSPKPKKVEPVTDKSNKQPSQKKSSE